MILFINVICLFNKLDVLKIEKLDDVMTELMLLQVQIVIEVEK